MADPQRVYGARGNEDSDPLSELRSIEGGGEGDQGGSYKSPGLFTANDDEAGSGAGRSSRGSRGGLSVVPSPSELEEAESSPTEEISNDSAIGDKQKFGQKLKGTLLGGKRRRRAIGIGGGALIAIGALVGISMTGGAFELIHLGQILGHADNRNQRVTHIRTGALLRAAHTGEVGETRLGYLGSKVFHPTLQSLSDAGIDFATNDFSQVKAATIDTEKLSKNYPELKDMNDTEKRAWISEKFGIPADKLQRISSLKDKYAVNTRDFGVKATRAFVKSSADVGLLDDGKTQVALKTRVLTRYFDLPGLFHPLKKATAEETKKLATKSERKKAAEDRARSVTEHEAIKTAQAQEGLKENMGKLGLKQGAAYALLLTAGMCLIRDSADKVIEVNEGIVNSTAVESTDAKARASQLQTNQDLDSLTVAREGESLTDANGKNVFQGRAIQALAGQDAVGEELPVQYQQAYSPQTTQANIKNQFGGGSFGGLLCSGPGLLVQGVAGFAILVSGFVDAGASWGAKAGYVGAEVGKTAATAGAFQLFKHFYVSILSSKALIPKLLNGPLGGNLLAYGARTSANMIGRTGGGIALSGAASLAMDQDDAARNQKEFQSRPLVARMFDRNDYRSGISRVGDKISPNAAENMQNVALAFTHIGSAIPGVFSSLIPKAHAAPVQYVWPMPNYTIPDSLLNSRAYEDPYANAASVAGALDSPAGKSLTDRAKSCFGVEIGKDSDGLWGVVPKEPVNPNSDDYVNADCANLSDQNWKRMIMFVQDSGDAESYDCYKGGSITSDQSCTDIGVSSPDGSNAAAAIPQNNLATGDSKSLAQQILPFIASGQIYCGSAAGGSESADCSDIQNTAKGAAIGGNCAVDALTPHLLALILGLARDDHWKLGISAICSDHHPEGDGPYAGHSYGSVADFSVENGSSGAAAASNKKFVDDAAALLKSSGGSFGQVGNCHPIYASQQGSKFTTFTDSCSHQHIRAAP